MQARVQSGRVSRRHTAATGQSSVRSMGCCTVKAVQRSIPYTLHVQRIVCAALSGPGIDNGSGSGSSCSNSGSSSSSSPASSASDHTGSSSRRQLLLAGGTVAWATCISPSGSVLQPQAAQAAQPKYPVRLRMARPETLGAPPLPLFSKSEIIEYPRWLFGEWQVTSTFTDFVAPLGESFVDRSLLVAAKASAEEGGIGSSSSFTQRWFSTLPNSFKNQMIVNLGLGIPKDAVVQDRAFNTKSSSNAYLGFEGVESVQYDPRDAPDKAVVVFSTNINGRKLPPKRAELFINNAAWEDGPAEDAQPTFYTSELLRQVTVAVGDVSVNDYEVLTQFELLSPGHIQAKQMSAVYLDPRQPKYFQAGSKAVAVYTFKWDMVCKQTDDGSGGQMTCVETPKDVIQCI